MVTTAARRATSITTFFRRKDVVVRIINFLSIKISSPMDFTSHIIPHSVKKATKKSCFSAGIPENEITLDHPTTHFGGQGLFRKILGFNHWVTSLSTDSTLLLLTKFELPSVWHSIITDLLLILLYHRNLCRSVSDKRFWHSSLYLEYSTEFFILQDGILPKYGGVYLYEIQICAYSGHQAIDKGEKLC